MKSKNIKGKINIDDQKTRMVTAEGKQKIQQQLDDFTTRGKRRVSDEQVKRQWVGQMDNEMFDL